KQLRVTASIGLAEISHGQGPHVLIQCADEALYRAKQSGRNQVQLYGASASARSKPAADSATNPPPAKGESRLQSTPAATSQPASGITTDAQTGLPNRTAFCEETRRRLLEAQRHGTPLSLMLIQLDNLTELTAKHGATLRSLALRTSTQFLTAAMREI